MSWYYQLAVHSYQKTLLILRNTSQFRRSSRIAIVVDLGQYPTLRFSVYCSFAFHHPSIPSILHYWASVAILQAFSLCLPLGP